MHIHFCGNPAHDVPMLLSVVVAEGPTLARFFTWLRARFTRKVKP